MTEEKLSYKDAGVNIDEAQRSLRTVTSLIQSTYTENTLGGVGGFGGLFRAAFAGVQDPILVTSIDGVGTKTKVAAMVGSFKGLGHDLVNHCVNDILCQGARPLFFLDYYGCARLSGLIFEDILTGLTEACRSLGCALIGGETAEMPGVYADDEFDIVGSIVGVVDGDKRLPRANIEAGDALVGLGSDGLHTNGYSMARKALEMSGLSVRDEMPGMGTTIGEELLRPHRCYLNSLHPLIQDLPIKALAHITGGGLYDNVPRILPGDKKVMIEKRSWTPQPIFDLIQQWGGVSDQEMYRTFNMGVGMVAIVDRDMAAAAVQRITQAGDQAWVIGEVQQGAQDVTIC